VRDISPNIYHICVSFLCFQTFGKTFSPLSFGVESYWAKQTNINKMRELKDRMWVSLAGRERVRREKRDKREREREK
jgi:hypothetical protein